MLFKTVCDVYSLIPEENYTIPPEAEGLTAKEEEQQEGKALMRKQEGEDVTRPDEDAMTTISTGATTRRHKSTHSFSSSVAAIAEGDEEDGKADSPAKDNAGGPTDDPFSSMIQEAPLAQTSKTTEKTDEEPASSDEKPAEESGSESNETAIVKDEIIDEAPKDEAAEKDETPIAKGAESASGLAVPAAEMEKESNSSTEG